MTEYVDENWTDQLRSELGKKSLLNWWIEYDPQSTHQFKGRLEWRNYHIKLRHLWEIKSKFGKFELFLTFDENEGARKVKKGIQPFLTLTHNKKTVFSTYVGKKGHKQVDAKALIPNSVWCDYAPQYNLKPHVNDLVNAIINNVGEYDALNSVYMINGNMMTGKEIYVRFARSLKALFEAVGDGVGLIDNRVPVELMGTPKKASIQRVASTYLKKIFPKIF